ncbi:MAG: DUF4349 domain-containing protein [Gemmatimonadaceae bacterium]
MNLASLARRRAPALSMLALAILAAACVDRLDRTAEVASDLQMSALSAPAPAAAPSGETDLAKRANMAFVEASRSRAGRNAGLAGPQSASPRLPASGQTARSTQASQSMIIRNGDVSVQVDSLEAAMNAVRSLATSLGGYIGNVSVNTGEHQVRSASLEMKVPVNRFDDAMAGMKPLGKVQRSTATAQDVGEEFVDVTARTANAKRLEARLVDLLASRTARLQDVLAVERELARVREEIERYEGRIRYLTTHVSTSTIVATVHEKAPLVATRPGHNPIRLAFVNMWRNAVRFVAWSIEALGVAIPLALIGLIAFKGWQLIRASSRSSSRDSARPATP